jgi:hypothetical protein
LFSGFRSWPARRFPKAQTDREAGEARRDNGAAKIEPIVNEVIRNVGARANEAIENAEAEASAAEGKAVAAAEADLASAV